MFSGSQSFGASHLAYEAPSQGAPTQTQEVGQRRGKVEERQPCVPVTIRMVDAALHSRREESGDLHIHGVEPGMLILVGCVEALSREATSLEFTLNDATGRMKARFYLTDSEPKHLEGLVSGRYVSLFGNVRTAPVVHIAVTGMRLVSSADEISYHMIEAAHAALRLRRGPQEPATPAPKAASESLSPQKLPKFAATEPVAPVPMAVEPKEVGLQGEGLRAAILDFIRKAGEGRSEGVAVAAVLDGMAPTAPEKVRGSLTELVGEGEVFTTIDDDHFSAL